MLTSALSVLPPGGALVIPEWKKLLSDLDDKFNVYRERYRLAELVYSPGIRLLRELVFNIDTGYLLTHTDDYSRYTNYISYESDNLKDRFDPVYKGRSGSTNMFVAPQGTDKVTEFIIGVDATNPMMTWPMDKDWNAWKDLRPFRMWYNNSTELITEFFTSQVKYKDLLPHYSVTTIDVGLLMFKYVKYIEHVGIANATVDDFIKNHVVNKVLDDLLNSWLFNLINKIANSENVLEVMINYMSSNKIPNSISDAVEKCFKMLDKYKKKNISLNNILNTQLTNTGNLNDILRSSNRAIKLPNMRQYLYLNWFKNRHCVSLYTTLNNLGTKTDIVKRYNKNLRAELRSYKRSNIFDPLDDIELKNFLVSELIDIEEMLK